MSEESDLNEPMGRVPRSAARLQELVPDAVLVGGSAVTLYADTRVVVPTIEEMLRVKAYLVVQRNYVRDYLDVVGLADVIGTEQAVSVLGQIDEYYTDRSTESGSVLTALVTQLADPKPRDTDVIHELSHYKGLDPRWHEWSAVVSRCRDLSLALAGAQ